MHTSPFNFNNSITLTKSDGLRTTCFSYPLVPLENCTHWTIKRKKKTKSVNSTCCGVFNTAVLLFLEGSRGSEWFFHLGKKPLSETPAKPDILLWHGCELWAVEKQTPRRSPSSPSLPRLFRRCRPADHSLISCTCQEGLSSKTAACVLLICWLRIMNFKWRLTD